MELTAVQGNVIPAGNWVFVRKCVNDHIRDEDGNVVLFLDDNSFDGDPNAQGHMCEIIGVSEHCRYVGQKDVGKLCLCPELHSDMHRIGYITVDVAGEVLANEDFAIKETALMEHCPAVFED